MSQERGGCLFACGSAVGGERPAPLTKGYITMRMTRQEALVRKMTTDPLAPRVERNSYEAFTEFAQDLKQDLDATVERNAEMAERLWNA